MEETLLLNELQENRQLHYFVHSVYMIIISKLTHGWFNKQLNKANQLSCLDFHRCVTLNVFYFSALGPQGPCVKQCKAVDVHKGGEPDLILGYYSWPLACCR